VRSGRRVEAAEERARGLVLRPVDHFSDAH
jgi:hypothetical protein